MGRNLAWIGVVLFVVSWFVPVVKGQDTMNELGELGSALADASAREGGGSPALGIPLGGPPGWQACRMAWRLLTDSDAAEGGSPWKARVCGSTCLTNLAMVFAVFVLVSHRAVGRGTVIGLFACAALNLSWLVLGDDRFHSSLTVGYYLWVGSFALVAAGLLRGAESTR